MSFCLVFDLWCLFYMFPFVPDVFDDLFVFFAWTDMGNILNIFIWLPL
jgi:hypothetical protein